MNPTPTSEAVLSDAEITALRSEFGWSKETIRAIEAKVREKLAAQKPVATAHVSFDPDAGVNDVRIEQHAEIPDGAALYLAAPVAGGQAGMVMVPREVLDRFPEINPSNYDHDDACALNAWGVELVLAAEAVAQPTRGAAEPAVSSHVEMLEALAIDIEATDVMYRGSPFYARDGYWMREKAAETVRDLAKRIAAATPTEGAGHAAADVPSEVLRELLDAHDAYARASMTAENAANNFTDDRREQAAVVAAMTRLSRAEKVARAALETIK